MTQRENAAQNTQLDSFARIDELEQENAKLRSYFTRVWDKTCAQHEKDMAEIKRQNAAWVFSYCLARSKVTAGLVERRN